MNTYCFLNTFYVFANSREEAVEKFQKFNKEYFAEPWEVSSVSEIEGDMHTIIRNLMKYEAFMNNSELKTDTDGRLSVIETVSDIDGYKCYLSFNKCLYGYDAWAFLLTYVSTSYTEHDCHSIPIISLEDGLLSHAKLKKEITALQQSISNVGDAMYKEVCGEEEGYGCHPQSPEEFYETLDEIVKGYHTKEKDTETEEEPEEEKKGIFQKISDKISYAVIAGAAIAVTYPLYRTFIKPLVNPKLSRRR